MCRSCDTELAAVATSSNEAVLGEISTAQAPRPSWTTPTGCPATVSVPVRAVSDELPVRLTLTTPLPVSFAPLVIDIQPLSETALHVHWRAVVTLTEAGPPDAPTDNDEVESVKLHGPGDGSVGELLSQPTRAAAQRDRRKNKVRKRLPHDYLRSPLRTDAKTCADSQRPVQGDVRRPRRPTASMGHALVNAVPSVARCPARTSIARTRRELQEAVVGASEFCSVETLMAHGKSWREILRTAAARQSDLIVMGVQGRGVADILFFGSTTQHAGCAMSGADAAARLSDGGTERHASVTRDTGDGCRHALPNSANPAASFDDPGHAGSATVIGAVLRRLVELRDGCRHIYRLSRVREATS